MRQGFKRSSLLPYSNSCVTQAPIRSSIQTSFKFLLSNKHISYDTKFFVKPP